MNLGRLIGDALRGAPAVGNWIGHLRSGLRARRLARRHGRDGGPARRYAAWVGAADTPSAADLAACRDRVESLRTRPLISLLMVVEAADPAPFERSLESLRGQVYPDWEACVVVRDAAARHVIERGAAAEPRVTVCRIAPDAPPGAGRATALAAARGDFVAMLDAGDVLPPTALFWIAEAVGRRPDAGLVFGDEDRIDAAGRRHDPWFKGDCNRELLLAHDAVSRPAVYARGLVRDLGGWRDGFEGAEDHDLALRAVAAVGTDRVVHVPRILCHRGPAGATGAGGRTAGAGRRAAADLLRRLGSAALVEPAPEAPTCNRIRHPLPTPPPLVSILVCTRDHEQLLRTAIDSITARTTYPRHEIVVVDNGSTEPGAVAHLAELAARPGIRVLRDDAPFNYSRLNNRAAAAARGEVLCLLNDDVEVLTPGWLEELVSFAVQPDVGAVGARLWYPDGMLQHAGVVLGIGRIAGHAHPRLRRGDPGYFGRAVLQQELTAVTGACLAVRADVFAAVGGLDEALAVAFNDVDFCLRLRRAGHRTVWTPFAELVHHESASRGADVTPAKRARAERELALLVDRWGEALRHDRFYNPNLSHVAADFSVDVPAARRRVA